MVRALRGRQSAPAARPAGAGVSLRRFRRARLSRARASGPSGAREPKPTSCRAKCQTCVERSRLILRHDPGLDDPQAVWPRGTARFSSCKRGFSPPLGGCSSLLDRGHLTTYVVRYEDHGDGVQGSLSGADGTGSSHATPADDHQARPSGGTARPPSAGGGAALASSARQRDPRG